MRSKWAIVAVVVVIMAGLISFVVGVALGRVWQYSITDRYELEDVANRLQVVPDWEAVRHHVYCEMLVLGSARNELESKLGHVGPYHMRKDSLNPYYTVYFDNYFTRIALGDLYLAFDENGRLIQKLRWTDLGDTVDLNCP